MAGVESPVGAAAADAVGATLVTVGEEPVPDVLESVGFGLGAPVGLLLGLTVGVDGVPVGLSEGWASDWLRSWRW